MEREKVYLIKREKGEEIRELSYRLMELIGPEVAGRVLVKPNLTCAAKPQEAITTHPEFCQGVIEWLQKQKRITAIAIGEGAGFADPARMEEVFEVCGYKLLSKALGVPLIDLNLEESVILEVPNFAVLSEISVARVILDCDLLINLPVLKTHALGITTLGMKNLMGFILPADQKKIIHERFQQIWEGNCRSEKRPISEEEFRESQLDFARRLTDLVASIEEKVLTLTIVDGSCGREGDGFWNGRTKDMNIAFGGSNVVAVDAMGTKLMGFNPEEIPYLKLAAERDLGPITESEIELVGETNLKKVSQKFRAITFKEKIPQ